MTTLYLAWGQSGSPALVSWDWASSPLNVLVALPFLGQWDRLVAAHPAIRPARLMLDSGAYSAWRSGKVVDIEDLIARSGEARFDETVGLDVIGSAEGSRQNLDYMRSRGSPAMPVFHVGDPWELLDHYCDNWPKVGLSCRFGEPRRESVAFYRKCFARRWPHRFHSFGWTELLVLREFPFHSADSSTWCMTGGAFRWCYEARSTSTRVNGEVGRFRGLGVPPEAMRRYAEVHVARVVDAEAQLRARWAGELASL